MEFIPGFAWPVPMAFASAVAACRFEQGDVLYSDRRAYGPWKQAAPRIEWRIQVLDPPRSSRALPGESDGKRFHANWESPLQLELARAADASLLTTTQGRVFNCLWLGDVAALAPDAAAPAPPRLARELQKQLGESLAAFRQRFAGRVGVLYLSVLDQASDASRIKAEASLAVLRESFEVEHCDLSPQEAQIEDAASLHPALTLRGLAVAGADEAQVEQALKGLLYTPAEGKADRFSLSRHGLLATLPGA